MSSFLLKIIAIITMFIDHVGYVIFGKFSFFNYIGRLSFPIFAFQICQGYTHTKNLKKYFLRLFLFAIISQIPFMLFRKLIADTFYLNIFFTLVLGLLCIFIYDKSRYKILGIIVSIFIATIAQIIHCDYGFYGVAIILIFYIFRTNITNTTIFFSLATLIRFLVTILKYGIYYEYLYLAMCTISSIIFIALYNGKKGKNVKYLLYAFYPVHLLLIYGISLIK